METVTRQERVARITVRIHEELKLVSLEELEDILNSLILFRSYKFSHLPLETL